VFFVPVSIGYERIVEGSAFERELSGEEKQKEDAAGLFEATGLLRSRYGRMNLQFGQLLSLHDVAGEEAGTDLAALNNAKRRTLVTRLGNRVMDEINRVTAVTPGALTAIALLSHHRRGLPHEKLLRRCQRLLSTLKLEGARFTPLVLTSEGELRVDSIREALQLFLDGEMLAGHAPMELGGRRLRKPKAGPGHVYTIPEQKRIELDTTKNIIIHFFVERALVATAMLSSSDSRIERSVLRERVQWLSRLFKHEFRFRADAPFDTIFDETLARMRTAREVEFDGESVVPGDGHDAWNGHQWLMTYAAILRNFFEGYRIAARALLTLFDENQDDKDWIKRALATGNRMYLAGEVERPEAISKLILTNALESFLELGFVRRKEGKLCLVDDYAASTQVRDIEDRIALYLEREGQ
jgi:glycerol-3-phosphate O-acyltransferase